jgi:hypothetical protein
MCSAHLFGIRHLVNDVRTCDPIRLNGVGGHERVTEYGHHSSFGRVILRPKSRDAERVNLLSLGVLQTIKGVRIRYNQSNGAFFVTGLDGITYEFTTSGGSLFVCDLSDAMDEETSHAADESEEKTTMTTTACPICASSPPRRRTTSRPDL